MMAEGEDCSTNLLEVCPTSRQHAFVFASESSLPQNFSVQDKAAQRPAFGAPASITLIVFSAHAFVVSHFNQPERKETEMKATCINQIQLAARWGISHRTLERWRWTGEGPKFVKLGGRVVYRLSDIEEYEQAMIRSSTSDHVHTEQAGA
jgi:predicted DNA-binding transcriptional regulator AlpA